MSNDTARTYPVALTEGPGALAGWGSAKLYHAGLAELEYYHQTPADEARAAHAAGAQAYFLAALAKSDQVLQEKPRLKPHEVAGFLRGLRGAPTLNPAEVAALNVVLDLLGGVTPP